MDRMIYLSMSGAKATMQRQDTLANNLANVSTTGFRAELQAFRAVPVQGSGASTRVYALETTTGYDGSQGPITGTGRNLDVAVKGNSWLSVQALDGTEAYTRGGALELSADGTLTTRSGLPVLVHDSAHFRWLVGSDGSTVDMAEAGALTRQLQRLQATPTAAWQRPDVAHVRARFDWPVLAPAHARLYRQLSQARL